MPIGPAPVTSATRPGPGFRGGAQDQPVDLLPGLGHDAARLGEHAQVAELVRDCDREPRADPPAGGAVPVQALDPALGVAAVHAEVRLAGRAGRAGHRVRAADDPGHQVAGPDRRVRRGLEDPAEGFVPDDQPRPAGRRLPAAAQDFRVGPADAGQQPLDQDRAFPGRRIGQLGDQLRAGAARDHAHRLHVSELIQPGPSLGSGPALIPPGRGAARANRQGPRDAGSYGRVGGSIGTGAAAAAAGRRPVVPIGFGEFALADKRAPLVTVVVHDPAVIGTAATRLLFTWVNGDTSSSCDVLLLTWLMAPDSDGPHLRSHERSGPAIALSSTELHTLTIPVSGTSDFSPIS